MVQLILSHSAINFEINRFVGSSRPRVRIGTPELRHTNNATPVSDGTQYEPLFEWTIEALIDPDERNSLERIYALHLAAKTPCTLDDYTEEHYELAPRTRRLATGASVTTVGTTVQFYAQFAVWFTGDPVFSLSGGYDAVKFSLLEYRKLAA